MVAQDNNMKQADVREFVDNLFNKITKVCQNGDSIKLGIYTFGTKDVKERTYHAKTLTLPNGQVNNIPEKFVPAHKVLNVKVAKAQRKVE